MLNEKKYKNIIQEFRKLSNQIEYLCNKIDAIEKQLSNNSTQINQNTKLIEETLYVANRVKKQFSHANIELIGKNINSKKKNILLCGYYGAFNLGDEIMLQTFLKTCNIKNCEITIMLNNNPYTDLTRYGNYNFIHMPKNVFDIETIANLYDGVIFCGGALIDDTNYSFFNDDLSLGFILVNLSLRFIQKNKMVILYGLSTNKQLIDRDFISKLDIVINNATYVSLRDTNSLNTLKNSGIKCKNIKIVNDIVFANDFKSSEKKNKKEQSLGIMLLCHETNYNKASELLKTIKNNASKYENIKKINFIPCFDYFGHDQNYYNELVKDIGLDKTFEISIEENATNFEEFSKQLNKNDYIISSRYHGCLISYMLKINTLTLINEEHRHYFNKLDYLTKHYHFDDFVSNNISPQLIIEFLNSSAKYDNTHIENISKETKEELKNVGILINNSLKTLNN